MYREEFVALWVKFTCLVPDLDQTVLHENAMRTSCNERYTEEVNWLNGSIVHGQTLCPCF